MILWQLLAMCGIAFLILEMFTPSMFFLNFSLASFICAVLSLYTKNSYVLVVAFFVFSFVSFIFLRPIIMKKLSKSQETGINSKYIGKIAKAETEITGNSGVISIYGERWEARSEDGTIIPKDGEVKIIRNESIIMYVSEAAK
ncbi:MAG: NfeD family protein [Cyanobacteria bacterium SIG31]|nr:NfeD family protein [Cyanobacteria bacterium SIG31]